MEFQPDCGMASGFNYLLNMPIVLLRMNRCRKIAPLQCEQLCRIISAGSAYHTRMTKTTPVEIISATVRGETIGGAEAPSSFALRNLFVVHLCVRNTV